MPWKIGGHTSAGTRHVPLLPTMTYFEPASPGLFFAFGSANEASTNEQDARPASRRLKIMNSFLFKLTVLLIATSFFVPVPWAQAMVTGLVTMLSHPRERPANGKQGEMT
jgi:hypothetical protein